MRMEIARTIVEKELAIRAQSPTQWSNCPKCGSRLLIQKAEAYCGVQKEPTLKSMGLKQGRRFSSRYASRKTSFLNWALNPELKFF